MWTSDKVCLFSPYSSSVESVVIFSHPTHSGELAPVVLHTARLSKINHVPSLLCQQTALIPFIRFQAIFPYSAIKHGLILIELGLVALFVRQDAAFTSQSPV